jgi:hypothetical protein
LSATRTAQPAGKVVRLHAAPPHLPTDRKKERDRDAERT